MKKILTKPLKIRKMGSTESAQITIPKEVLSIMKLEIGDYVDFDFYMEDIDKSCFIVHKKEHEIVLKQE